MTLSATSQMETLAMNCNELITVTCKWKSLSNTKYDTI